MTGDQDMRDLLIRLDQKVGDGFQNIDKKLDNMERRADACVFRKVPDSDSGKSRTVISESPGQAFR